MRKRFFFVLFIILFITSGLIDSSSFVFAWDHPMQSIHIPEFHKIHSPSVPLNNINTNNTTNSNTNENNNQNVQSQTVNQTTNIDNENSNSIEVNALPTPVPVVVAAIQPVTIAPAVRVTQLPETGSSFAFTAFLLGLLPLGVAIRKFV